MEVFSMMPIEVFMDERLTKTDTRVLGAILSFRDKKTNLCWPKRGQISERCRLSLPKISTSTTHLVKLGWLKKTGDGGRSRSSSYELIIPNIKDKTVTDSGTVFNNKRVTEAVTISNNKTVPDLGTVPKTVTVPDLGTVPKTVTVPDSGTKTVPDSGTKTVPDSGRGIKQTNEQTNKRLRKKIKNEFVLPDWVDKKIWDQWMQVRKVKKLVNTDIALNALIKNILKAKEFGINPDEAMIIAVEKSWGGFDAQWIVNLRDKQQNNSRPVRNEKRQAVRMKANNFQTQDFIDVQFQRVAT